MANTDTPNGFRPVKALNGASWNSLVRRVGVADLADIFIGDAMDIDANGLAGPAATNTEILGVAVGFGKNVSGTMTGEGTGAQAPFDPSNLESRYYDDSASTHTDWFVWYVPANGVVFEAQTATGYSTEGDVNDTLDLVDGGGNTTTGISGMELTTTLNADVVIVERPDIIGSNDFDATNARYWVVFKNPVFGGTQD